MIEPNRRNRVVSPRCSQRRGLLLSVALAVVVPSARSQDAVWDCGTGPKPSPVPASWELEFEFISPPRRITSGSTTYWYMLYRVTNPDARTARFFPQFELVTEDLRVFHTDIGISRSVFDAIYQVHKRTYPDLMHPTLAIGDLKTGDDNARESVAVWRDIDLNTNQFVVYVSGLSGETRLVPNRLYDPRQPETERVRTPDGIEREVEVNPKNFTLRKTLEIRYTLPGSQIGRQEAVAERGLTRWVMR